MTQQPVSRMIAPENYNLSDHQIQARQHMAHVYVHWNDMILLF